MEHKPWAEGVLLIDVPKNQMFLAMSVVRTVDSAIKRMMGK